MVLVVLVVPADLQYLADLVDPVVLVVLADPVVLVVLVDRDH